MDMNKQLLSLITLISLLVQYLPVKAQSNTDWMESYLQPGEKSITLAQSINYEGQVYQIHYFTTSDLRTSDSNFIGRASPEYFRNHQITALFVSSNGGVILDEVLIEQVLL